MTTKSLAVSGGKLYVSFNGGAKEAITDLNSFTLAQEGKYAFSYTNGVGQSADAGVYYVTYGLENANLASVKVAKGKIEVGSDVSAKLYRAGEEQDIASMKVDKDGKYYLEINKGSETEIIIFNTDEVSSKGGCNSSIGGTVSSIVALSVCLVAAAIVCPVVILKGRKRS